MSQLLSNQLIARLERLRVQSLRKVANRGRGEQLAGRGGSSIDFADYRDYTPGDDLRFVDWNIFSRLERPYLKLFRREEERHSCRHRHQPVDVLRRQAPVRARAGRRLQRRRSACA